jgi:O-6-methylguanine DNA methyltransferase
MSSKVYYNQLTYTPVGDMWVAVKAGKLIALVYDLDEVHFKEYVKKITDSEIIRSPQKTAAFATQVLEYLEAKTDTLKIPTDISGLTPFQRQVLQATLEIPRGQIATYGLIARKIGKPNAYRAVGQALRRNPIAIVIPCHRVIGADGSLTGYSGKTGIERKSKLLKIEGVTLA